MMRCVIRKRRSLLGRAVLRRFSALAALLLLAGAFPSSVSASAEAAPRWEAQFAPIDEPYFSFVWLTDTQTMTEHPALYPAMKRMFRWIVESRELCHTVCVIHTGDIVEYGGNEDYWARISPLIGEVQSFLPFLSVAGNHDIDHRDEDWSHYLAQPFLKDARSMHFFQDGKGAWTFLSACGIDILLLGLGYNETGQEAIGWAKAAFAEHPGAVGVFITHSYLSYATSKTSVYTGNGDAFRVGLVSSVPEIRFVLCGHVNGTGHVVERYDDDGDGTEERTVHALRYNCQESASADRSGFLRVLTVFPRSGRLRVYTYSPYLDLEVYDPHSRGKESFFIDVRR